MELHPKNNQMDILSLPFNKFIGMEPSSDSAYLLTLPAKTEYENHIQTVHAAALFALAEASNCSRLQFEMLIFVFCVCPSHRNIGHDFPLFLFAEYRLYFWYLTFHFTPFNKHICHVNKKMDASGR